MGRGQRRRRPAPAGHGAGAEGDRDDRTGTQRGAAGLRRSLRRDQGADRGLRPARLRRSRRGDRGGPDASDGPGWTYRDPSRGRRRSVTDDAVAAAARGAAATATEAYPRIVAALIRVTRDWTLAEDCAQDALALALARWPADGVPANPAGWLMTVARNPAIDPVRRGPVGPRPPPRPAGRVPRA